MMIVFFELKGELITQLEENIIKLEENNCNLEKELRLKDNDLKILTDSNYKYKAKKDHLKKNLNQKDEQIIELKRQLADLFRNNQNELYYS